MLGIGLGVALGTGVPPVTEAAVAALGPVALFNVTDPSSLLVGRDGSGGNPAVGGTTSIGLVLDKAQMGGRTAADFIAAQPQLVANGEFASTLAGWSAAGNAALTWQAPGRLRVTRTDATAGPGATQTISGLTVGRTYLLAASAVAQGGTGQPRIDVTGGGPIVLRTDPGALQLAFTATATSHTVALRINGSSGAVGDWVEFDNASFRAVPGRHAVASADNARPVLAAAGERLVARHDGVDDRLDISLAAVQTTAMYVAMALQTTDTTGILFSPSGSSGNYAGAWFQGGAATAVMSGLGTPTVAVNGAAVAVPTRGEAHAAFTGAGPRVVEIVGADLSAAGWAGIAPLWFNNDASYRVAGDLAGLVVLSAVPTAAQRDTIRRWLATLSGAAVQ